MRQAPVSLQPLAASIHGPLWAALLCDLTVSSSFPCTASQSFPCVGQLPPCEGESAPDAHSKFLSAGDLKHARLSFNHTVVRAVKQLPFSEDVLPQVSADCEQHFMSFPRAVVPADLFDKSLARRIPVREKRAKGWRTRVADHETENGINPATEPVGKIRHDPLDVLSEIVMQFYRDDCDVLLGKSDISQAFRRVPIQDESYPYSVP